MEQDMHKDIIMRTVISGIVQHVDKSFPKLDDHRREAQFFERRRKYAKGGYKPSKGVPSGRLQHCHDDFKENNKGTK